MMGSLHLSDSESFILVVKASVHEQKNLHADLIGDRTQNSLNESTVSYFKISMFSLFFKYKNVYYVIGVNR
jgi:hypothetical protein